MTGALRWAELKGGAFRAVAIRRRNARMADRTSHHSAGYPCKCRTARQRGRRGRGQ
jgi:hypothetical protein